MDGIGYLSDCGLWHWARSDLGGSAFSASRELAIDIQPLSDYEQISLLLGQAAEEKVTHPGTTIAGHLFLQAKRKVINQGLSLKWLKYQIDALIHTLSKTSECYV